MRRVIGLGLISYCLGSQEFAQQDVFDAIKWDFDGDYDQDEMKYPPHWGNAPTFESGDLTILPGGYGYGSSTLGRWIQQNMWRDQGISSYNGKAFPKVWGEPPAAQTKDLRPLPCGYGLGSGTLK